MDKVEKSAQKQLELLQLIVVQITRPRLRTTHFIATSLLDRQKINRLGFFYKVVEGLVSTLQCHDIPPLFCGKR